MKAKWLIFGIYLVFVMAGILGCDGFVLSEEPPLSGNAYSDVVVEVKKYSSRIQDESVLAKTVAQKIITDIKSLSNDVEKVMALSLWADVASDTDISSCSYKKQREIIRMVNDVFIYNDAVAQWAGWLDGSVEKVYDIQIDILRWQLQQIERLKPQRKIKYNDLSATDCLRYLDWRECYISAVSSYEHSIRRLERIEMPIILKKVSSLEGDRIVKKIEGLLGRKLRSPEESVAAKGEMTESDEMKAVWRSEVGP